MSTSRKRKQVALPSHTSQNGRVFTDSDEIRLLKTFKKLTQQNPSSLSSPSTRNTTITVDSQTFNRINSSLGSKFSHAQITDKLRRLRIKYRKKARSKSLIKTPHDQSLFKIAQLIWGNKTKKQAEKVQSSAPNDDDDEEEDQEQENEQNEEQERERVDLDEYPVLVDEFSKYLPMNLMWREALKSLGNEKLSEMNEKWMRIGIEEAKIVTMKADLVKKQTQLIMEALGDSTITNGNEYDGLL